MNFHTVNPYTTETLREYQYATPAELERTIALADQAARDLRELKPEQRSQFLGALADVLKSHRPTAAKLITAEMGKPIGQSEAEIDKCIFCLEYYQQSLNYLTAEKVTMSQGFGEAHLRPLGVLLAVMPWNFPFWQVVRVLAPNILLGNVVLLKHATSTTGCALFLSQCMREASQKSGFNFSPLQVIVVPGSQVSAIVSDNRISAVTLTGSAAAGRSVAEAAGRVLKKTVLELGGSDPYIVLQDADIVQAARSCVMGRLVNSGQSCVAAKRFIVVQSVFEDFVAEMTQILKGVVVGDPMDSRTHVGPLARQDLVTDLQNQYLASVQQGAREVDLNLSSPTKGFFFSPKLLVDVTEVQPAFREETFGPLVPVTRASDEDHAIELANHSSFGLGAAVFSKDQERAASIARERIHAGLIAINAHVQSDPRLPFGGVKESGYGRELSHWGVSEFANIKTVIGG